MIVIAKITDRSSLLNVPIKLLILACIEPPLILAKKNQRILNLRIPIFPIFKTHFLEFLIYGSHDLFEWSWFFVYEYIS